MAGGITDAALPRLDGSASAAPGGSCGAEVTADITTACVFRREGDFWTVTYEGVTLRLRDAKGLQYLAHLLTQPGERVSVVSLGGGAAAAGGESAATERARVAVTKRIKESIRHIAAHHAALGYHLTTTIKTGSQCVYLPDPQRPVAWAVQELRR